MELTAQAPWSDGGHFSEERRGVVRAAPGRFPLMIWGSNPTSMDHAAIRAALGCRVGRSMASRAPSPTKRAARNRARSRCASLTAIAIAVLPVSCACSFDEATEGPAVAPEVDVLAADPIANIEIPGTTLGRVLAQRGNSAQGPWASPSRLNRGYTIDGGTDPVDAFAGGVAALRSTGATVNQLDCEPTGHMSVSGTSTFGPDQKIVGFSLSLSEIDAPDRGLLLSLRPYGTGPGLETPTRGTCPASVLAAGGRNAPG